MSPIVWLILGLVAIGVVAAIVWSAARRSDAQLSAVRQEMQNSLATQGQSVNAQINHLMQAVTTQLGQVRQELQTGVASSGKLASDAQIAMAQQLQSSNETIRKISMQIAEVQQAGNAMSQSAQTLQNVVTYDAVIDVENPNLLLRPGMTANCTFVATQKDNVVRLRNAALRFQPDPQLLARIGVADPAKGSSPQDPNRKTVWVLRDNKPVSVAVSTGVSDGTWSELVAGDVQPGDVLITDMTLNARRGFF